jgi:DNA (cytosine-5)-methyltransferase 1
VYFHIFTSKNWKKKVDLHKDTWRLEKMAISYNNLWKKLIDKKMNKGDLCRMAQISKGTMAKMTNNESVTLTVIEKICMVLQCNIEDVVQIVDSEDNTYM